MSEIKTYLTRGKNIESIHSIKCLIINSSEKIIFSTNHDEDIIFPRSAIKILQAIPFVKSGAIKKFSLNKKQISLSCSSHIGEKFHISELSKWIKKLDIPLNSLKCGIHNPINLVASNKLLLSGTKPTQLHNNCAGKHLGMISASILNNFKIKNYLNFDHQIQKDIRKTLELFSEKKIKKINYAIDGCGAPQYGFKIKDLAKALLNLNKSINYKFDESKITNCLISAIFENPKYIGGTGNLDSKLMSISNKQIFCKGGAEGVFLFTNIKKNIAGVLKVIDGNQRVLPSALLSLIEKFKLLPIETIKDFKKSENNKIKNHAKNTTGSVFTLIR